MGTTKLDKAYPELSGLPLDVQIKIFKKANAEAFNSEENTTRRFKTILVATLVSGLAGAITYSILYLLLKNRANWNEAVLIIASITGVLFGVSYNHKKNNLLKKKIKQLIIIEKKNQ